MFYESQKHPITGFYMDFTMEEVLRGKSKNFPKREWSQRKRQWG